MFPFVSVSTEDQYNFTVHILLDASVKFYLIEESCLNMELGMEIGHAVGIYIYLRVCVCVWVYAWDETIVGTCWKQGKNT